MNAFACMQLHPNIQPHLGGPSLWQPPMKTWMEFVAEELGCEHHELRLCRQVDESGVERWWWEKKKEKA